MIFGAAARERKSFLHTAILKEILGERSQLSHHFYNARRYRTGYCTLRAGFGTRCGSAGRVQSEHLKRALQFNA